MELGWDSGNGDDSTQGGPKRSPLTGVTQRRGISAPLGERGSPFSKIILVVNVIVVVVVVVVLVVVVVVVVVAVVVVVVVAVDVIVVDVVVAKCCC